MQHLKKLRLINWHFFINEEINIADHTLITGENGTGKSTLLDAIQYVLTGGKPKFNSAAHDQSRRDLLGYVRAKTGDEKSAYARTGDISSHVALEFCDADGRPFVIGAVIDSPKSLASVDTIFYIIEDQRLDDSLFLIDNIPLNISGFKKNLTKLHIEARLEVKQGRVQEMVRSRFGGLEPRFFSMLTKSLTFKAMKDVNDFVYHFLLDKKELEVDSLKENIAKYQEFETILQTTREQLAFLNRICEQHGTITKIEQLIKIEKNISLLLEQGVVDKKLDSSFSYLRELSSQVSKLTTEISNIQVGIESLRQEERQLHIALEQNADYRAVSNIKRAIQETNQQLGVQEAKVVELKAKMEREVNIARHFLKEFAPLNTFVNFGSVLTSENKNQVKTLAYDIFDFYQERLERSRKEKVLLDARRKEVGEALFGAQQRIGELENRELSYPPDVVNLRQALQESLSQIYKVNVEVRILCELLEINDDSWRDAIEGYLGMNKFNIIVEPKYFDQALRIYEQEKRVRRLYNVGLVNTNKFLVKNEVMPNSLANYVTSPISYVSNYLNSMIGTLICCDHVDDLKKHQRAITKSVMIYQNHTARAVDPRNFSRHYIGQNAYKSQLGEEGKVLSDAKKEYEKLLEKSEVVEREIELLKSSNIEEVLAVLESEETAEQLRGQMRQYKMQLADEESGQYVDKEAKLRQVAEKIIAEQLRERDFSSQLIEVKAQIRSRENGDEENRKRKVEVDQLLAKQRIDELPLVVAAEERVAKLTKKPLSDYLQESVRRVGNLQITCSDEVSVLKALQMEYNNRYQFSAAPGMESINLYQELSAKLKVDELLKYEEKALNARMMAESQFKEQWLAKIRENIEEARRDLTKINSALRGVYFGKDEYEFRFLVNPANEAIYQMIMDQGVLDDKVSFDDLGAKYPEAMDRIRNILFGNNETNDELLDYRNYMIYDIWIKNEDEAISFAKVCREKSGGETQTPYYVTIIAAFIQLYKNTFPDSIGIILFDEVFDKMDDSRISSMMQFISRLDLQVLMAAPPQRMEDISRYCQTTLVLIRDRKSVKAQEFISKKEVSNV